MNKILPWERGSDISGSEGGMDGDIGLRGGFGENHGGWRWKTIYVEEERRMKMNGDEWR